VVSADWHGTGAEGPDVLVVDPDITMRALLATMLEREGLTVAQLNDGHAALAYLTGSRERALPRVMVMELDLLGIDGLALLRALVDAGVLGQMRVLVVTARVRESELLEALSLGASDYVTKPLSPGLLLHRLRRVMGT
jgi:CheY-like chemotaxis protein